MRFIFLAVVAIGTLFYSCHNALTENSNNYKEGIINSDSLRKYSYSLFGYYVKNNNPVPVLGSCFFIRDNGSLYMITAKHVIMQCEPTDPAMPSVTNIFLEDSSGHPYKMIPVNVARYMDTSHCKPDIIAIKIPDNFNANSVEKFLFPRFEKVSNVEIYGFPGIDYSRFKGQFVYSRANHLRITESNDKFFVFTDSVTNTPDTLTFAIKAPNIMIAPYTGDSLGGFSGSPIFIKDANSERWRVGGAFVASSLDSSEKATFLLGTEIKHALDQIYKNN